MKTMKDRLEMLRTIISNKHIGSQDELLDALRKEGFNLTQATLSRDLRRLKAVKIPSSNGQYGYVLSAQDIAKYTGKPDDTKERTNTLKALSMRFSDNIGVIKTLPGYASALAYDIDNSNIPEILGTIAGDDTIIVIIEQGINAHEVKKVIEEVCNKR